MSHIETHGLTKRYGGTTAVRQLDLVVKPGEIYGLLGPNGAGKSTTIAMLAGGVKPTSGSVRLLGHAPDNRPVAVRRDVGIVVDSAMLDGALSARQHVAFALRAHQLDGDPLGFLDRVGLGDAAGRRVRGFSTGMLQRLQLAIALVGEPELLLLDEPANGLDPGGQRWLRDLLGELRADGRTILISSHRLPQIEALSDRVGILVDGRLRREGAPADLADASRTTFLVETATERALEPTAIRDIDGVTSVHVPADAAAQIEVAAVDSAVGSRLADTLPAETTITTVSRADGLADVYRRLTEGTTCA